MLQTTDEKVCPSCKNIFYPQESVVCRTFCGEENLCAPPEESYRDSDCKVYHFCSEICAENFEKATPTCSYIPAWKKLMAKIDKVSGLNGVKNIRPYQLYKNSK